MSGPYADDSGGTWMQRRTLRGKALGSILLAIVPLLTLSAFGISYAIDRFAQSDRASAMVTRQLLATDIGDLVHRLQIERGLSVWHVTSQTDDPDGMAAARRAVDVAQGRLRDDLTDKPGHILEPNLSSDLQAAIAGIPAIRDAVAANRIGVADVLNRYTPIIAAAISVLEAVKLSGEAMSPPVGRLLAVYMALVTGSEYAGRERALGTATLRSPHPDRDELRVIAIMIGAQQASFRSMRHILTPGYAMRWMAFEESDAARTVDQLRALLFAEPGSAATVTPAQWFTACTTRMDELYALQRAAGIDIAATAEREATSARNAMAGAIALCVGAVLATLWCVGFVATLITSPLRRLALSLAHYGDLERPIELPVDRRDEVGDLARAFARLINRLRDSQAGLRRAADRHQMLINGVVDYAIYWLDPKGHVESWNTGAEKLKGYRQDEIIGRHFSIFFTAEDRAAMVPQLILDKALHHEACADEGWRVRKDGSKFWARVHVEPIRDQNGALVGFAKVSHDETWRTELQQARKDALDEVRAVINAMTDGLIVIDMSGAVLTFSPSAEQIFGYAAAEVTGQDISILIPAEVTDSVGEARELIGRRKDGSDFEMEIGISAYEQAGQKRFVAIVRDITARKAVERDLETREERLSLAWRGTGVGMWDWNIATNEVVFSRRFKELLGYAPHEMQHHYDEWETRIHPDDKPQTARALVVHMSQRTPFDVQHRLVTKSGEWRWFHASGHAMWDDNGTPIRMAGSLADITESRLNQDALRASEETFRSAMDAAPIGMALVGPNGKWRMVNPSLCELLGREAPDLLETDFQSVMLDKDRDACFSQIARLVSGDTRSFQTELRCVHSSGRIVWVALSASLVRTSDGVPSYLVCQLLDVTERRQMAILQDEFVSTVNHELRTPLSSLYGSIRLLQSLDIADAHPKAGRLITLAESSCERLTRLVNDILDLEKIAAGKMDYVMETAEVGPLVQDIVDRHQPLAERFGLTFQTRAEVGDAAVYLDRGRFNQALVNLLSNAAKYSPKGETVEIHVVKLGDGQIRVSVVDRGPGIPLSFRHKVFQRFAQADSSTTRKVGGSGLGLNITKRIIEAFEGTITFETEDGAGTTFHIILPIQLTKSKAA